MKGTTREARHAEGYDYLFPMNIDDEPPSVYRTLARNNVSNSVLDLTVFALSLALAPNVCRERDDTFAASRSGKVTAETQGLNCRCTTGRLLILLSLTSFFGGTPTAPCGLRVADDVEWGGTGYNCEWVDSPWA